MKKEIILRDSVGRFIKGCKFILSQEHKDKIGKANSIALRGRKIPLETRIKMSLNGSQYWKGKKLSEEHKLILSSSHKLFFKKHPDWQNGERTPCWNGGTALFP